MTKILVVDDEITIVEILQIALEDEGYDVLSAYDGQEALQVLEKNPVNLVLCDVMMPRLNGIQLCQRMQAHSRFRHIPIILMSAVSQTNKAQGCHVDAMLSKPFELDSILDTVENVLTQKLY